MSLLLNSVFEIRLKGADPNSARLRWTNLALNERKGRRDQDSGELTGRVGRTKTKSKTSRTVNVTCQCHRERLFLAVFFPTILFSILCVSSLLLHKLALRIPRSFVTRAQESRRHHKLGAGNSLRNLSALLLVVRPSFSANCVLQIIRIQTFTLYCTCVARSSADLCRSPSAISLSHKTIMSSDTYALELDVVLGAELWKRERRDRHRD